MVANTLHLISFVNGMTVQAYNGSDKASARDAYIKARNVYNERSRWYPYAKSKLDNSEFNVFLNGSGDLKGLFSVRYAFDEAERAYAKALRRNSGFGDAVSKLERSARMSRALWDWLQTYKKPEEKKADPCAYAVSEFNRELTNMEDLVVKAEQAISGYSADGLKDAKEVRSALENLPDVKRAKSQLDKLYGKVDKDKECLEGYRQQLDEYASRLSGAIDAKQDDLKGGFEVFFARVGSLQVSKRDYGYAAEKSFLERMYGKVEITPLPLGAMYSNAATLLMDKDIANKARKIYEDKTDRTDFNDAFKQEHRASTKKFGYALLSVIMACAEVKNLGEVKFEDGRISFTRAVYNRIDQIALEIYKNNR